MEDIQVDDEYRLQKMSFCLKVQCFSTRIKLFIFRRRILTAKGFNKSAEVFVQILAIFRAHTVD